MNLVIQKEKRLLAFLVVVFTILTVGLTFFEYISYQKDKQLHEAEVREQLITINSLKTNELTGWREENIESAEVLNHSGDFSEHVESYLEDPDDLHNLSQVRSWLQVYKLHNEYESIQLLDTDGNILIFDSETSASISEKVTSRIPDLLIQRQVQIIDFYFDENHQQSRLAILIPILSSRDSKQAIGLVAVIIDPNIRIFPSLQEWPVSSESGESFLIRLEAQEASVISPSAENNNEQFTPRYQLTNTSIPPLQAETDLSNIFEGMDYRGTPVVAAVNAIPNSPWVLVTQLNRDEAFASLRDHLIQAIIQWISLFSLFGAVLAMVWRGQRTRFYRQQIETLDELKQSRERYQNFISHSFEAISRTEFDSPIDITLPIETQINLIYENAYMGECNQAMADMYNIASPEEFIGVRLVDAHQGNDNLLNRAAFRKFIQSGYKSINDETQEVTATGQVKWFLSNTVGIIEDGHLIRLWGTAIDITDRKQAEEALNTSRQLLQTIIDNVPVRVFWKDKDLRYLGCNPSFAQDAGETDPHNIIGKDDYELGWRAQADFYRADDQQVMDSGVGKFFYEEPQATPNGQLIMISTSKVPLRDKNGQTIGVLGIYQDVTEQKRAEELILAQRDLAYIISTATSNKEALSRSFAIALRVSGFDSGGIYLLNEGTQTLDLAHHHGLGEEFIQASQSYPADAPNVKMLFSGTSFYFNDADLKDREIFITEGLHSYASIPIHHHGQTVGCINVASHAMTEVPEFARRALEMTASEIGNIVAYLKTEASLRENEEKYRSLINSQESSIAMLDVEGVYHYINEIGAARLNHSVQGIIGKKAQDFLPPETVEWKINVLKQVLEAGQGVVQEVQLQEAKGKFWHRISVQPIKDSNGKTRLAMVNSIDITERKNAEAELQYLKDRLLEAQQLAHVGSWEWDMHKQVLFWSEEVYRIFGVNPAEFLPTVEAFEGAIHPEDRESFLSQRAEMLEKQQSASIDHRIILPDGQIRHVTEKTQLIKDNNGNITRVIGTVQDITEQKLAEEALVKSQELLSEAQKIGHIGHWEWTFPERELVCSDELYRIFEIPKGRESISQQAIMKLAPPEEVERLRKLEHAVFSARADADYEYYINTRDGRTRWIHHKAKIHYSDEGQPIHMMGTIQDVTEYKQAQEDLQSAYEFLQGVQNALSAHLAILDENGVILQVNSAWREFGKANGSKHSDACVGMNYLQVCDSAEGADAEEAKQVAREIRAVCSGEKTAAWVEYPCHSLEEKRWYVVHITKFTDRGQIRIVLAHENITERRMAEEALRASEERYRMITSYVDDIVWQVDTDFRFVYVSSAASRVLGYTNEEAHNLHIHDLLSEEDAARMRENIMARIKQGQGISNRPTEYKMQHKNGNWIETEALAAPVFDKTNRLIGFAGITRDISERKVIERQLQEAERKYRTLVEFSPVVVYVDEIGGEWQYISPQIKKILGYSPTDFLSDAQAFKKLIHPDDLHRFQVDVNESLKKGKSLKLEYRMLTRDGSYVWIHDESDLTQSGDNGKHYLQGVFYDITERKQAEEALTYNERRFRALIENIADGIQLIDIKGEATYVSPSAARLLGYLPGEMEAPITSLIHADDLSQVAASISKAMTTPQTLELSYRVKHKDGGWRWFEGSITNRLNDPAIGAIVMTYRDVTEQKQADDKLKESEERFRQLADNIQEVFWMFDRESKNHIYANPAYRSIFGISEEDIFLEHLLEIVVSEDRHILQAALEKQVNGEPTEAEYRIKWPDHTIHWIWDRSFPVYDENGNLTRTAGVATDVTISKKAEIALRESEEKYRGLMESLDSIVSTIDSEGRFYYLNDKAAEALGGTVHNIIGKTMYEIFPKETASPIMEKVQTAISEDKGILMESMNLIRGEFRWYRTMIQPIHDAQGKVLYVLTNSTDIHDLKMAQHDLQELNNTLEERVQIRTAEVQDLYDNAPNGYHSLDANGALVMINQTELNWLGYTRHEVLGKMKFRDLLGSEDGPMFDEIFSQFITSGKIADQTLRLIRKDGSPLPVLLNAYAIYDEYGNFTTSRCTITDITERVKIENALRESRDQLSAANVSLEKAARLKDEFLASMSHELRTPLTGVLGLSEALQLNAYGELNEKQLRTVKAIEESGRHLLELINDILDLSKIEAGKLDLQFTAFSINDICQASLQLIKGMANQKRQNVHFTPPSQPILLNADPRRIKQILVNLLSNAVKFTPDHGELGLTVEVNPADENISIAVWDKGIGIKAENIHRLFKPFTQIDSSLAREYSGTGLGLSLAHRLVELHGGRIELESIFGEGSRFTVILPWLSEEPMYDGEDMDTDSLSSTDKTGEAATSTIMVADDNETVLEMITDFLESKQYRVTKARSGAELIQKLPDVLPDLILVDIQMPGMDGLETIRLIRSSTNPVIASVPIIAVTALAMPGDRERCLRAGATDYMSKPMKLNELAMLIRKRKRPQ